MTYGYYKHHAWAAGLLLAVVLALRGLEIIDLNIATILAVPIMAYLVVSLIMAYRTFKEKGHESVAGKRGISKDDAKLLRKVSKNKLKAQKKSK